MASTSSSNPDALAGAPLPIIEHVPADGSNLYVEVRGAGAAVLVIGAADEDAEVYRGVAERLAGDARVVTYDRRGTGQSGREGWPADSAGHADDAAAVIRYLGLDNVTVLGASAGGIVGLRLALRHPELAETVLCFEPGTFEVTREGRELRSHVEVAVEEHLKEHPGDWSGASDALGRAAVAFVTDIESLFTPPPGREWFAERMDANAESLIRGELRLTGESYDLEAVANCPTRLRFAYGTASLPVFKDIAIRLADTRGQEADPLEGVGHGIPYHPDEAADYVRGWLSA